MKSHSISREYHFDAAHRLPQLPPDHKCHHLHGHTYKVEVVVTGPRDERGFVIDYAELDRSVKPIIDGFDHKYLNDIVPDTTAEGLAEHIYELVSEKLLAPVTVKCIRLWETTRSCVEFGQ